jgi:HEAT repeat protein
MLVTAAVCTSSEPAWAQNEPATTAMMQSSADAERWGNMLLAGNQAAGTRDLAAGRLAAAGSPAAAGILAQAMQSSDPDTANAAAKAVGAAGWADPQFVSPLEIMLGRSADLNASAASALAQYSDDADVANHLLAVATNSQSGPAARVAVIDVLGVFAFKDVAAALMELLEDANESPDVRQASADALASMTGSREFGRDAAKWQTWWDSYKDVSADEFSRDLQRQRAARFGQIVQESARLNRGVDRLLKNLYFTAQTGDQGRILDSYLTDDAPEIRVIGAEIVAIDVGGGRPLTPAERARLLSLLAADPAPEVRAAAAAALAFDPTDTSELLHRLAQEQDTEVRVAILSALASHRDPAAITAALPLLDDSSPELARGAADLIAASGALLRDPKHADMERQVKTALLDTLERTAAGSAEDLRASVTAALASLGDPSLYERLVHLSEAGESEPVRTAAIGGLGELARTNPDVAAVIADFVDASDSTPAVQLEAVEELAFVSTTAYVDRLVDVLHATVRPSADVSNAIWQTEQAWFPLMSDDRLSRLAERMKNENDFAREVDVRRFYVARLDTQKSDDARQMEASQRETVATRELYNLNDPAGAAADFAQVLTYYESKSKGSDDIPHNPARGEAAALLAQGAPYDRAVQFAADTLSDAKRLGVVPDVLEQYPRLAEALASNHPEDRDAQTRALDLVKAFDAAKLKIPPSLSYVSDNMDEAAKLARQNLANMGTPTGGG